MAGLIPPLRVYHFDEECMIFSVTFNHCAERVKRWIHRVKQKYLDSAPTKCVDMDCKFTITKPGSQKHLPLQQRQRAAVLQLCVAREVVIFQIVHVDAVLEALRGFLGDHSIR
jgi:hypothetical protein